MLRFTPYAWAKLVAMRDFGKTEVGGFGVSLKEDPLLVVDFTTVKQKCTSLFVAFDDDDVSDYLTDMAEKGFDPNECMRIWIHTHPAISPTPSGTDETTFRECFGKCDWSVMFILSTEDKTYCRISFKNPNISKEMGVKIDWNTSFAASDRKAWREEYDKNVEEDRVTWISAGASKKNFPEYTIKTEKEVFAEAAHRDLSHVPGVTEEDTAYLKELEELYNELGENDDYYSKRYW